MAQYIGYLNGARGQSSLLGTKSSGMDAQAQGWDVGASVTMRHNEKMDRDEVTIEVTRGSKSGAGHAVPLGTFAIVDGQITKILTP